MGGGPEAPPGRPPTPGPGGGAGPGPARGGARPGRGVGAPRDRVPGTRSRDPAREAGQALAAGGPRRPLRDPPSPGPAGAPRSLIIVVW